MKCSLPGGVVESKVNLNDHIICHRKGCNVLYKCKMNGVSVRKERKFISFFNVEPRRITTEERNTNKNRDYSS